MNNFRADLHCHSTCSDGTKSPGELVQLAVNTGLSGLAITDHDSIVSYELALPAAEQLGLKLLTGAEFSATHMGSNIHILAYAFSPKDPYIVNFCAKHTLRREKRNREIIAKLSERKIYINYDELNNSQEGVPSNKKTIGRPHIGMQLLHKGYVSTLQEAFSKYIGEGKPCYANVDPFSVEETLETIHQANGIAIIAHPHLINNIKIFRQLLDLNFDGLEGYYAKFPPQEQKRWVKIAENKRWLITGGSDYHGDIKPHIPLGCSWVGEEIFNLLKNKFQENTKS